MHTSVGTTLSKTEAMYFPPPRVDYFTSDTCCSDIRNEDRFAVGFVDFTNEFKLLGYIYIIDFSPTLGQG